MAGEKAVQPVGNACGGKNQGGGDIGCALAEPAFGQVEEGGEDGYQQNPCPSEGDGDVPRHGLCFLFGFQAA